MDNMYKTEEEFLKNYNSDDYEKLSMTTDILIFSVSSEENNNYRKTDKKKIGSKLKEIRNELNLSQQQLADDCKISQTTYSTYETGRYLVNTITIYTICKKYNISMDYLVGKTKN